MEPGDPVPLIRYGTDRHPSRDRRRGRHDREPFRPGRSRPGPAPSFCGDGGEPAAERDHPLPSPPWTSPSTSSSTRTGGARASRAARCAGARSPQPRRRSAASAGGATLIARDPANEIPTGRARGHHRGSTRAPPRPLSRSTSERRIAGGAQAERRGRRRVTASDLVRWSLRMSPNRMDMVGGTRWCPCSTRWARARTAQCARSTPTRPHTPSTSSGRTRLRHRSGSLPRPHRS